VCDLAYGYMVRRVSPTEVTILLLLANVNVGLLL